MQRRYNQFNQKRKIRKLSDDGLQDCFSLAEKIQYGGNPEHKRNPGDFGLKPPSSPRQGKSLCDNVGIFSRQAALKYLKAGLLKGLISDRFNGNWPQNIWSVTEDGCPLEAQLENSVTGTYHGYPMPESDPMAAEVVFRQHLIDWLLFLQFFDLKYFSKKYTRQLNLDRTVVRQWNKIND